MRATRTLELVVWTALSAALPACRGPAEDLGSGGGSPSRRASGAASAAPELPAAELRLASDVWPPFTDVEGRPRVALDLVHGALERAGVSASTEVRASFGDVVRDIREGRLDGSAAIWRSPDRERFLLFSRRYLENRLVLVGGPESDVSATSLEALSGRRVGVVAGYAYGPDVEQVEGPLLVEGPSDNENLRRLLSGEIDCLLVDDLLVHHLLEQREEATRKRLQVGTTPLVKRSLHFALRRDLPGAEAILRRFEAEIRAMMADGSYHDTLHLAWIRMDTDGDGATELVLRGDRAGDRAPRDSYELFAPETRGPSRPSRDQYRIEGNVYDSWDRVPPRYKTPPERSSGYGGRVADPEEEWGALRFDF